MFSQQDGRLVTKADLRVNDGDAVEFFAQQVVTSGNAFHDRGRDASSISVEPGLGFLVSDNTGAKGTCHSGSVALVIGEDKVADREAKCAVQMGNPFLGVGRAGWGIYTDDASLGHYDAYIDARVSSFHKDAGGDFFHISYNSFLCFGVWCCSNSPIMIFGPKAVVWHD